MDTLLYVAAGDTATASSERLRALLDHEDLADTQLVVVLAAPTPDHRAALERVLQDGGRHDVQIVTAPQPTLPSALSAVLPEVAGRWCVIWSAAAAPTPGWWTALRTAVAGALEDDLVVQPLVLDVSGVVASAGGRWFPGVGHPVPHLIGWPAQDAIRLGDLRAAFPYGPVIAVRTEDLRAMNGLRDDFAGGHGEIDLFARLVRRRHGAARVAVEAVVVGRSAARHGFRGDRSAAVLTLQEEHRDWILDATGRSPTPYQTTPVREDRASLRWAIDTAAPGGERGERWGDVIFARALGRALERHGQLAAVDTKASRRRSTRRYDEVILVLRGLDRVKPTPGRVNILWIISHPDLVTEQECREYDLVFAASPGWAERKSLEWGIEIRPLLQCTDPALFSPSARRGSPAHPVVFVGNVRGGRRELVERAIDEGLEIALYGRGWGDADPPRAVVAEQLSAAQVAGIYAASDVVICDHWADMRDAGFVSNRVFDVLASGTPVLCDAVSGVAELAPGMVHVCDLDRGSDGPAAIVRSLEQPSPELVGATVSRIGRDHSFDRRAVTLVDAALDWITQSEVARSNVVEGGTG
jgi:hypothetical protein